MAIAAPKEEDSPEADENDARAATRARYPTGSARVVALLVTDAAALLASGLLAYQLWAVAVRDQPPGEFTRLAALVALFTLSYALGGLYPGFGVSAIQLIRTIARQTSLVFLVIVGSVYVLRLPGDYSRVTLALWWAIALVAVPSARGVLAIFAARWAWWREPVLLVGDATQLPAMVDMLARARHIGYRPVAVSMPSPHPDTVTSTSRRGLPVIAESEIVDAARSQGVDTVLLSAAMPEAHQRAVALSGAIRHVLTVHSLDDFYVEPSAIRYLGNAVGIEIQNRLLMRRNQVLKRAIDVALAAMGLVATLPIMALAAIAVAVCDPGPWWHAQEREGRNGRSFRMWKLRTMYRDADARLETHLAADAQAREEWQREFKLSSDPRVLPVVGALLRRWSLDECPQFLNVIAGDMSLVGPRALPAYHLDAFGQAFRTLRQRVRPGMTGMWQVMSRGNGAIERQESLDSYYIYNWSIWMDAFIIARTVIAVIGGRGAR